MRVQIKVVLSELEARTELAERCRSRGEPDLPQERELLLYGRDGRAVAGSGAETGAEWIAEQRVEHERKVFS